MLYAAQLGQIDPGAVHLALVERGCVEVIVTADLDPLIVTALTSVGTERRSRA